MTKPASILPPRPAEVMRELLVMREFPRLAVHAPRLASAPRGSGPVLALPGHGSTDRATAAIRRYLGALGYAAYPWRLGRNDARVEALLPTVTALVERIAAEHDRPVALIGWSNGGVIAREVARDRPELVRHVFTYGSPIVGGPRFTQGARGFAAAELDRIDALVAERNAIPIQVPVTSFWSRRDGFVSWRACIDDFSPFAENVEVTSSHLGMTLDASIWRGIADRLAATPG